MPSSIARATARSRSATLPPINSPPMFPQPKPSAATRSPVPPSDRCSISHLLLLIYGPRTAHGSFYAPTSAVNRAGTNFPLDGGFAGRDKRGHSMSRFPVITPPALAELRARIGRPVPRPEPYIEVATRDAVRHWAAGIGDRNPFWLRAGVAPPTILFAMDRIVSRYVGGLPGIHAMYGGTDFRWRRPIHEDDRLTGASVLLALEEKPSAFARRAIKQTYRTTFTADGGDVVADVDSWC